MTASTLGPAKLPPLMLLVNAGSPRPNPKACISSCVATVWKSN